MVFLAKTGQKTAGTIAENWRELNLCAGQFLGHALVERGREVFVAQLV
jgi:hypothetical protein